MNIPLLQTKLHSPHIRQKLVPRPHLIERLNEGLPRKVTLIAAPAGYGKTTLISAWLHQSERPAAWLSLSSQDNDPTRFLIYFVAALQTIAPTIGDGLLAALRSSQPPPLEATLTALLNKIAAIPDHFLLVLDDYHLIETPAIDEALAFLLDHLPAQMHLVITTREDPQLPLARYRARRQMTELRAADLRFTPAEATGFLNQVMGLNLSEEQIAALEARTEGWIAGLQMAALSIQGRADTAGFIQAFTGSHRFVLDYLVEEVLQRQPEPVRDFLLHTSILERLSGPLCDAVVENVRISEFTNGEASDRFSFADSTFANSQAILEHLEQSNLFLIPLDDQRQWYRYHHLFADVLQTYLMKEKPNQIPSLHRRASRWYQQNNSPAEAIHHAFAAKDFEQAATLIELTWPALRNGFQPATWLGWVQALPDALLRTRPVLNLGCAWTLLDGGELEEAEASLRNAEQWLDTPDTVTVSQNMPPQSPPDELVVVNHDAFRSLPASIASAWAYLHQTQGDASATIKYARRALELWSEDEHYWRGNAALFLGMAYWANGQLDTAAGALADAIATFQKAGNLYFQIVSTVCLAGVRVAQGRLHQADRSYRQAMQLSQAQGQPVLQQTADLYIGLAELHRERGDLQAASQHLQRSQSALAKQAVLPGSESRWYAAKAHLKQTEGEPEAALWWLDQNASFYKRDPLPNLRPVAALIARLWVRQGRLTEALDWVRKQGLSADDDLSYLHEFEYITLARVLIAQYQHDGTEDALHRAMVLLERLLQAAEAGGRTGSVIEILILQALAHEAQGNIAAALEPLAQALTLGKTQGYLRIFIDEGDPMQTLLSESLARGANAAYVTRLLTALTPQPGDDSAPPDPNQLLIEPLSPRERQVLDLLVAGYTNQAIADKLVIALSTVKKHVNNIYGKLGVGNRTQAVSRARKLGLL